jgi:hypothetical protein
MPSGLQNWSQTAATTASADSAINWAEGQPPSSVNDSARGMMAVLAKHRDDTAGTLTTAGTSTAYTLTTNTVFTTLALLSGQRLKVKFNATNGVTPTLNVDGLGAKNIQLYSGTAIPTGMITANSIWDVTYDNSIPAFVIAGIAAKLPSNTIAPASLAFSATQTIAGRFSSGAGAGEELTLGSGILLSGSGVLSAASAAGVQVINATIAESRSGNATTYALKTLAGTDPSASDPVYMVFRNATAGTGDYVVRTVSAALSITIPSTATMGFGNSTPSRIWGGFLDNAGTVEMYVVNCLSGINIYPLGQFPLLTTTTIGTGAGSAHVPYSGTGRTAKAYVVGWYADYIASGSGLIVTAGTWNVAPDRIQLYGPGVQLPGGLVQIQQTVTGTSAFGSTTIPFDNTIPQSGEGVEFMTQAITPTSSANLLEIGIQACLGSSDALQASAALYQDSVADALAAIGWYGPNAGANNVLATIQHSMRAGTLSATTFKLRAGTATAGTTYFNRNNTANLYGGVANSFLRVVERVA